MYTALPRISPKVSVRHPNPSTVAWLPCKANRVANHLDHLQCTCHVFPALYQASLFSRSAPPSQSDHGGARPTRHDKPLLAQGIFAFRTKGQKGNDPCGACAITRGWPGEAWTRLEPWPCRPFSVCTNTSSHGLKKMLAMAMTMVTCLAHRLRRTAGQHVACASLRHLSHRCG